MEGNVVVRKAGWDCHGLPVEREVEKELGFNRREEVEGFGVSRFNELCRKSVWKYEREWELLTERMGYWVDMKRRYATLDKEYMESEWWALKELWKKGLLKRGHKVLPYSPHSGCTYSNRDVEEGYKEVTDLTCFVRFPLVGPAGPGVRAFSNREETGHNEDKKSVNMLVWTSTPWTLPGNVLLAVNKGLTYVLVKVVSTHVQGKCAVDTELVGPSHDNEGDFKFEEVLVVAKAHLSELNEHLPRDGRFRLEVMQELKGSELLGMKYKPPLSDGGSNVSQDNLLWEVVHADFVTETAGTGVVHVAPMYGEDDYNLCVTLGVDFSRDECQHVVGLDGCFVDEDHGRSLLPPVPLRGLDVTKAGTQKAVLSLLGERGLLQRAEAVTHKYPFCWRNKSNRLLYYAMDSWFVTMGEQAVRTKMQELNSSPMVSFSPEGLKEGRFGCWLRDSKDWCLSRKRSWGCPLPVWVCQSEKGGCGKFYCVGSRAELCSLLVDPDEFVPDIDLHSTQVDALLLKCVACGNNRGSMQREPYVLDCWFDSGCAPFAQWHYPFAFSTDSANNVKQYNGEDCYNGSAESTVDFVAEGQDQCRGWFYSLLAVSSTLFNRPAYKHCLALGLVLDREGQKMSKSKGNGVDPWRHFNQEGADALRWYLLGMCAPWSDRRFDSSMVRAANQRFFNVLYNVAKWWFLQWESTQQEGREAAGRKELHEKKELLVRSRRGDSPSVPRRRGVLDRWVLSRLVALVTSCNKHLGSDHFELAVANLESFVNDDLSKTYLRLSRAHFVRVPCAGGSGGEHRRSNVQYAAPLATRLRCLETMREVLLVLSRLVAPLAPFFVDRLHRCLRRTMVPSSCGVGLSVHLASWPVPAEIEHYKDMEAEAKMQLLQAFLQAGREVHKEGTRPGRMPVAHAYCVTYQDTLKDQESSDSGEVGTQTHAAMTEELAGLLAFELNVAKVTLLGCRGEFDSLLEKVQLQTLAPNMKALGARFRDKTPAVVKALRSAMNSSLENPDASAVATATTLKENTNVSKSHCSTSSGKKSKTQLKREQRAEARRTKKLQLAAAKKGPRAAAAPAAAAMTGPLVDVAVLELQSVGKLAVRDGDNGETYELLPHELAVVCVPRPSFAVSVKSLGGSRESGKEQMKCGLVLDLAADATAVSRYLAKEVAHFVQRLRKDLDKERLRRGSGPLQQVALRVVVFSKRDDGSSNDFWSGFMSPSDWAVVMEDTRAAQSASSLEQGENDALKKECDDAVRDGAMVHFSVRGYDVCPHFSVYVRCVSVANA
uniref:Isoleucine--tRNA ligase n=1 Tax=Pseudictyota dubia TaxID=2749911 RepID=A0A7R9ZBB4_9STRA|mmetsp:Transcript_33265/g.61267  ORF Transcript_33265/g.61267 Transcript_33265/m.61267 type:complete len:1277 (+) Transcript_33265:547-4377(+)